ncbi:hypothetical protein [Robertmurraya andreesenii]|uniref:Uncharacterized protein n=1 Tax=Anoxybacillus andreesenii TaxID=1325932 RepID=A0ABT9UZ90_9BACL|nr:hypothetical protein [Robertmurraya andreesenii]MDQ0153993.1 hypothetical protein [Robertmurraya andreesenii]
MKNHKGNAPISFFAHDLYLLKNVMSEIIDNSNSIRAITLPKIKGILSSLSKGFIRQYD